MPDGRGMDSVDVVVRVDEPQAETPKPITSAAMVVSDAAPAQEMNLRILFLS